MLAALDFIALLFGGAVINRFRGGGFGADRVPVKALWLASPALALLAMAAGHQWPQALAIGILYLVWALPAWGRWFDLGRLPDHYGRDPEKYADPWEKWIDRFGGEDDHEKFFLRHTIFGSSGLILVAFFLPGGWSPAVAIFCAGLFPWVVVELYHLAWHWSPQRAIPRAEMWTGAWWGFIVWITGVLS